MRQAILSAAALLLLTSNVLALERAVDPNCPSPQTVMAVLQKQFPKIKLTHMAGIDARRFVDAFNSSSASTSWPADEVLIARNPQTPGRARIGFFKDGCLLALVPHSPWDIDNLQRTSGQDI
jgi:hypothetical protein